MSLYTVNPDQTAEPEDLNQLVSVLQQSPGGKEQGEYFIAGPVYGNGAIVSAWVGSLSRGSLPVSVTVDTSIQAPTGGMNSNPGTSNLSANGFQIYNLNTTGPNVNARAGGLYTLQY